MNYGYAPLENKTEIIDLDQIDEDDRYCIQLYHHVVCSIDLQDLDVLEVGSGRGGGASYIKRYLKPQTMVGVDLSENAVKFCNQNYRVDGLSFEVGNAECLPFADNSFHMAINVESSHCYRSMAAFLSEIERVLCAGGYFLFADFRSVQHMHLLQAALDNSGLTSIEVNDITPNIVKALELDNEHKTTAIEKLVPQPLLQPFLEFAGTQGSKIYEKFKNGETIYQSFVLQKQTGSSQVQ